MRDRDVHRVLVVLAILIALCVTVLELAGVHLVRTSVPVDADTRYRERH